MFLMTFIQTYMSRNAFYWRWLLSRARVSDWCLSAFICV